MSVQKLEEVKDYWNSRPCNIRHSNKAIGSKEYFDEVEAKKYKVEPHIPVFADFAKWKGKTVLEIGCGIGTDSTNFARHAAQLYAVDLSNESVKLTKQRLKAYGLNGVVIEANAERLTDFIRMPEFDLIYSFGVLHHTPDYMAAFSEVAKLMSPHTEFRLMVYHKGAFKCHQILEEYDFDYKNAESLIEKHSEAQTGCPVTHTFTPKSITEDLAKVGMEVTSVEIDHIFPYKIDEYKRHEYVYEDIWQMPEETFRAFEKKYGWHLLVTAKLKQ